MSELLRYDDAAARKLLDGRHWTQLTPALEDARDEVLRDIELFNSGGDVPEEKQPLDAGFIEYPRRLLDGAEDGLLDRMNESASALRGDLDHLVLLGIGGSYMGMRALFESLCHPYHNLLDRDERRGMPRLYFEGNNLDNDTARGLLELLRLHCRDKDDLHQRWGIVVISKSGGTLETAASFRIFREALEGYYGPDSEESRRFVVPITGETGKLRSFSEQRGYGTTFPVPDGIGGRFSVFTPVGLYPAAVLGIDIAELLRGADAMTEAFRSAPAGKNPVLDYVATSHLFERECGMTTRVLSTWGNRLEAFGLWYDQLLAESLGKQEQGATPLTVVNTRDLHSRGQQHQEGTRDKLITNVIVEQPSSRPLPVPVVSEDLNQDQLNRLQGKPLPQLLDAAIQGTNRAYAEDNRPTADILVPALDAHTLGQLLQMMMLATVVEGRLIGINPYGQPGVEAYKRNMGEILYGG
ncbi:MAG: glucose-6-phosphate isomerase [Maioricimonas sp. JB049]